MNDYPEFKLLKSMWKNRAKKSTDLIANVSGESIYDRELDNKSWVYDVTYHFREALDISQVERIKDKKPYLVWVQGPFISFKEGDLIKSRCGSKFVQVKYATPMGWDAIKEEMYQGSIHYSEFSLQNGSIVKTTEYNCSQMEFLELMMTGRAHFKQIQLPQ